MLASLLLCLMLLTACGGGDVSEVGRHIGVCERFSKQEVAYAWSENYGAEAIVLKSDFYVDDGGRSATLEPDETYRNYEWILTKTVFGWELRTWGYG